MLNKYINTPNIIIKTVKLFHHVKHVYKYTEHLKLLNYFTMLNKYINTPNIIINTVNLSHHVKHVHKYTEYYYQHC